MKKTFPKIESKSLGRYSSRRLERVGIVPNKNPYLAASHVAEMVRDHVGSSYDILDLSQLRALWTGLELSVEPLENSGYLIDYGRSAEIVVRKQDGPRRQRFTMVHEVGHWLIGVPHSDQGAGYQLSERPLSIEQWCDSFAADVLVPPERVRFYGLDSPMDVLEAITQVPTKFDISPTVAFRQVSDTNNITIVTLEGGTNVRVYGQKSVRGEIIRQLRDVGREMSNRRVEFSYKGVRVFGLRRIGYSHVIALIE